MKRILLLNFLLAGAFTCLINSTQAQFGCSITCPANMTVPAALNQCGANVTYPPATITGFCGPATYSIPSGSFFPVGTTPVTVSTPGGSCTFTITVVDKQAPTITNVNAVPPSLWPPNHKMTTVMVGYSSTDNCPGPITCNLTVSSNEPVNSTGDGNTEPDWIVVNNTTVQLRAERKGNGNGRIYTITVTCTDQYGNASSRSTNVVVPHDMSGKTRSENGVGNIPAEQLERTGLNVKTLSNPTRNAFTLNIQSADRTEKVVVKLFDLSGRMVESKTNINPGEVISMGSQLRAGTYLAELKQGSQIVKVKLVKL
jgi:hypothetical protein